MCRGRMGKRRRRLLVQEPQSTRKLCGMLRCRGCWPRRATDSHPCALRWDRLAEQAKQTFPLEPQPRALTQEARGRVGFVFSARYPFGQCLLRLTIPYILVNQRQ